MEWHETWGCADKKENKKVNLKKKKEKTVARHKNKRHTEK